MHFLLRQKGTWFNARIYLEDAQCVPLLLLTGRSLYAIGNIELFVKTTMGIDNVKGGPSDISGVS
jgi:hypothetical protein